VDWSCAHSKRIKKGARLFLLRQGLEPKGIVGSGVATSDWRIGEHWDGSGKTLHYVDLKFDALRDPAIEAILPREVLDGPEFAGCHWDTQVSGIEIPKAPAKALERAWASLTGGQTRPYQPQSREESEEQGGGLGGDVEKNRLVEQAAVKFVMRTYARDGWTIKDVQKDDLGYDLACRRQGVLRHIEVKGTSGSEHRFMITNSERRCMSRDGNFLLAVVTEALDPKHRKMKVFTPAQANSTFEFTPLSFVARPLAKELT
jgi:hypothetical protein